MQLHIGFEWIHILGFEGTILALVKDQNQCTDFQIMPTPQTNMNFLHMHTEVPFPVCYIAPALGVWKVDLSPSNSTSIPAYLLANITPK